MENNEEFVYIRNDDDIDPNLFENTFPRVPIVILVDVSISMGTIDREEMEGSFYDLKEEIKADGVSAIRATVPRGAVNDIPTPINQISRGIREIKKEMVGKDFDRDPEICVVTFGNRARVFRDFTTADRLDPNMKFSVEGEKTEIGEGILLSLEQLQKRKEMYKRSGVEYSQPMLIIMSDGNLSDINNNREKTDEASREIRRLTDEGKLEVIAVGIGKDADLEGMKQFSPVNPVKRLNKFKFSEFFRWLSMSIEIRSDDKGNKDGRMSRMFDDTSWEEVIEDMKKNSQSWDESFKK